LGEEQIKGVSEFFFREIVQTIEINMLPSDDRSLLQNSNKFLFFLFCFEFLNIASHVQVMPTSDGTFDKTFASIGNELVTMI